MDLKSLCSNFAIDYSLFKEDEGIEEVSHMTINSLVNKGLTMAKASRILSECQNLQLQKVQSQQKRLFSPTATPIDNSIKKRKGSMRFFCLVYCDQKIVPKDKSKYNEAGLGHSTVIIDNPDMCSRDFIELIEDAYPKLKGCGGFSFLRTCIGSKAASLELIQDTSGHGMNPRRLCSKYPGSGIVYLQPLQCNLSLTKVKIGFF
jgi:hypothetical protein